MSFRMTQLFHLALPQAGYGGSAALVTSVGRRGTVGGPSTSMFIHLQMFLCAITLSAAGDLIVKKKDPHDMLGPSQEDKTALHLSDLHCK